MHHQITIGSAKHRVQSRDQLRIADGLFRAHRRWPGGIYALWYPVKNRMEIADFRDRLAGSGIARVLDIRFGISRPSPEPRLDGCGVIVVNPPFTLEDEMQVVPPALHALLADDRRAAWSTQWLARE